MWNCTYNAISFADLIKEFRRRWRSPRCLACLRAAFKIRVISLVMVWYICKLTEGEQGKPVCICR